MPEPRKAASAGTIMLAFATLFGTMAGHTVLETARDALFLAHIPASRLPWVYLLIAGTGLLLTLLSKKRKAGLMPARPISMALLLGVLGTGAFYALSPFRHPAFLYALSVWAGTIGAFITLHVWIALGRVFPIDEAKKAFGVIGAGSVSGAIFGSLLARALAHAGPAQGILLGAAVIFALTVPLAALVERHMGKAPSERVRPTPPLTRTTYVRLLLGVAVIASLSLTLADFSWKSAVSKTIPAADLGAYFATAYLVLNVLSLFVQLFFAKVIFDRLGVRQALFVVPTLLGGVAGLGATLGGLWPAAGMKAVDGAMRYSVHKTSMELLAVPLADSIRERVKPMIDLVGQRGGQALGSLLILLCVMLRLPDRSYAFLVAGACLVWLVCAAAIRYRYVAVFRDNVLDGSIRSGAPLPRLDLAAVETLVVALGSGRDEETLGALRMLQDQDRVKLVPPLILYHPSPPVVTYALELFENARRKDVLPTIDRVIAAGGPTAAAALRARLRIDPTSSALLEPLSASAVPELRAAALVALVAAGKRDESVAEAQLLTLVKTGDEVLQIEVAQSVGRSGQGDFSNVLLHLAYQGRPSVQVEALRAMQRKPRAEYIVLLCGLLSRRSLRSDARKALAAIGERARETLEGMLVDGGLPHQLRLHLPRTLALAFEERSLSLLLARLESEPDGGVRFKVLRGLESIVRKNPAATLDASALRRAALDTVRSVHSLVALQHALLTHGNPEHKTRTHELVVQLLADKEVHARDRLFRLLGLLYPKEDMRRIYKGIFSPLGAAGARLRGSSRELLENVLEGPLREPVLDIVDAGAGAEHVSKLEARAHEHFETYEAALGACVARGQGTLRSLAALHAKEQSLLLERPREELDEIARASVLARAFDLPSLQSALMDLGAAHG
jgi:ATP:ADP antiporter, AAA family